MLLSALIVHGNITDDLSITTVLPIPKGKNLNFSDSANYRGIALSSIVGKILDLYILCRYERLLASSHLQFGFKAGHSTSMCTMVLKETIEHYRHNNSNVFLRFLDASKAFDRVAYCKLVRLLIDKKMPAVIVRFLLAMYVSHLTSVSWNNCHSKRFSVRNGVRQGAIISPVLFCVYLDVLLSRLDSQGVGCRIGSLFVGALAYADDLALVAPSANSMRNMLRICDEFAAQFNVVFNATKSKCIRCLSVGAPRHICHFTTLPSFCIGSQVIEYVDKWPHLGHIITTDCDDAEDIRKSKLNFIGQSNKIVFNFRNVDSATKTKLFKAYCTSFYGAEIWDLSHRAIESLCVAWRKGPRQVWGIPRATHTFLLPFLCESLPLTDFFFKRMLNFVQKCLTSESPLVSFVVKNAILNSQADSIVGRNVIQCCSRYHVNFEDILQSSFRHFDIARRVSYSDTQVATANCLIELLACRDGALQLSHGAFDALDVADLINCICTG